MKSVCEIIYEEECEWLKNQVNFDWKPDEGVYIDLGAAHPKNQSLTAFCRDLGWTGLAVDANPDYQKDWEDAGFLHHFVCALLSDQPTARFITHENSFTSRISDLPENDHPEQWGIKRIEERITVPLNPLLEMHGIGKIDLLTIDLEGHEFAVLQTLDFKKHSPAWIITEYHTHGVGVDPRAANFLIGKGYEIVHVTESNYILRKK